MTFESFSYTLIGQDVKLRKKSSDLFVLVTFKKQFPTSHNVCRPSRFAHWKPTDLFQEQSMLKFRPVSNTNLRKPAKR